MNTKARLLLAAAACALMVMSTSGCVDIYGARGIFGGKEPPAPVVYKERLKAQVSHEFDTDPVDPGSWTFSGSDTATVKKGTQWLTISIQVTMIDIGSLNITLPFPTFERYVHVQVRGADGSIQHDNTYYVSTPPETLTLMSPIDGPWSIHADATGYGRAALGVADSFKVMMSVREPG